MLRKSLAVLAAFFAMGLAANIIVSPAPADPAPPTSCVTTPDGVCIQSKQVPNLGTPTFVSLDQSTVKTGDVGYAITWPYYDGTLYATAPTPPTQTAEMIAVTRGLNACGSHIIASRTDWYSHRDKEKTYQIGFGGCADLYIEWRKHADAAQRAADAEQRQREVADINKALKVYGMGPL